MTIALILNVIFATAVIVSVVGHLVWSILRDRPAVRALEQRAERGLHAARPRPAYARRPRRAYAYRTARSIEA